TPNNGKRIAVLGDMTNLLQYPQADRRNKETLIPSPTPSNASDSNLLMPKMSNGFSSGTYTEDAHRQVGMQAASLVDYLVTRGERAALIAEAAQQAGLASTNIVMTANYEDAAQAVRAILNSSPKIPSQSDIADQEHFDVVLIKGSEETRMERVTELLMARSWEASETLVRQTPGWKKTIFMHAERPT